MLRFPVVLLTFSLFPAALDAGITYRFTTTVTTRHGEVASSGRVWTSGHSYRFEAEPATSPRKAFISNDGDQSTYVLNLDARTYYRQQRPPGARSSRIFHIPFSDQRIAGCPVVTHGSEAGETIAGQRTTKHTISVQYEVQSEFEGSLVTATIRARAVVWAAEHLPRLPMTRDMKTGFDAIDREIARANAEVDGMVLRHELEVSRRYTGGIEEVELTRTVVDRLAHEPIDAVVFAVPPDFQLEPDPQQKPAQDTKPRRRRR